MLTLRRLITAAIAAATLLLTACHPADEYTDNPQGNFEALWHIIDTRYCFFAQKDIDWRLTGEKYRSRVRPGINDRELFDLCAAMLAELRDGHVNLSSDFDTSYYRRWWSDYPQDFDLRTLQQYYLGFDYGSTSGIIYKILRDDVGYIYFPSFSTTVGQLNLDYILAQFSHCRALVIDIRDNGGGLLTNIDTFVSRFISHDITGGYISHKTGPGHDDFSRPYPVTYRPAAKGRVRWTRPVFLLINRSCYSAANDFASVMSQLPGVTLIGARTGGGGGLPFSSELPNGWSVRFSACPVTDADGRCIEFGVDPTPGYERHATAQQLAAGIDPILDTALEAAAQCPPVQTAAH